MFRRLASRRGEDVSISFEGRTLPARSGETVAAALLAANETIVRSTPREGRPRGAYCMMGLCFDCLMTIDGRANRQACQTIVQDGMQVSRQDGARVLVIDDEA